MIKLGNWINSFQNYKKKKKGLFVAAGEGEVRNSEEQNINKEFVNTCSLSQAAFDVYCF